MALNFHCGNGNIAVRIANHFILGVKEDIGLHDKHVLEKVGDVGLWMVEKFPRKVWHVMKDPRVVTLALTSFALLGTSFVFYPTASYHAVKSAIALLPKVPLWTVRLSAYIVTCALIVATTCRAEGRFRNSKLMDEFNGKKLDAAVVA